MCLMIDVNSRFQYNADGIRVGIVVTSYQRNHFEIFSAEFVISLAVKNDTFENFKKVLMENGAEFSVSIIFFFQS